MKLGLASPDLGSFLSLRDAAHGRRDGRVHGHEAGAASVTEARHVERAPAVEAVPGFLSSKPFALLQLKRPFSNWRS